MPRKPLDNERRHGKLSCYGEEVPQALLSALSHKTMPTEARCQEDRGINATSDVTSFQSDLKSVMIKISEYILSLL